MFSKLIKKQNHNSLQRLRRTWLGVISKKIKACLAMPYNPPNRGVPWQWDEYAYMLWSAYEYDYENYYNHQLMYFHPSANFGQGDLYQDDVR